MPGPRPTRARSTVLAVLTVVGIAAAASLVTGPASAAPQPAASHPAASERSRTSAAPDPADVGGLAVGGVLLVMVGGGALMLSGRGSLD